MKACRKCKSTKGLVKLYLGKEKYEFLCGTCWRKDLDNDSGNYFDNFMD